MRGRVREKRPGIWELRVPLPADRITGERRQRSVSFHGTKREANKELARVVAEADDGRDSGTHVTLGTLLDRWWDQKEGRIALTTAREYRRLIDTRIKPELGRRRSRS